MKHKLALFQTFSPISSNHIPGRHNRNFTNEKAFKNPLHESWLKIICTPTLRYTSIYNDLRNDSQFYRTEFICICYQKVHTVLCPPSERLIFLSCCLATIFLDSQKCVFLQINFSTLLQNVFSKSIHSVVKKYKSATWVYIWPCLKTVSEQPNVNISCAVILKEHIFFMFDQHN